MTALLDIKGLTTKVSGFTILNNLDFSIEPNELRVLMGPNGAGKTTLICMVTGQFKPAAGTIHFADQDITGWAPDDVFQAGISRKFQVPNLYGTLSVFNNVMVSLQGRRKVFGTLFRRLRGEEADRIWEILEFIELADKAADPADTLSHG
jgi:urea transport system ATP-binding protein